MSTMAQRAPATRASSARHGVFGGVADGVGQVRGVIEGAAGQQPAFPGVGGPVDAHPGPGAGRSPLVPVPAVRARQAHPPSDAKSSSARTLGSERVGGGCDHALVHGHGRDESACRGPPSCGAARCAGRRRRRRWSMRLGCRRPGRVRSCLLASTGLVAMARSSGMPARCAAFRVLGPGLGQVEFPVQEGTPGR